MYINRRPSIWRLHRWFTTIHLHITNGMTGTTGMDATGTGAISVMAIAADGMTGIANMAT